MDPSTMLLPDGSQVVLVHYLYRSQRGLIEERGQPLVARSDSLKIACSPGMTEDDFSVSRGRSEPLLRTDDPRAVSCPLCKETQVFQRDNDELKAKTR